MEIKSGEPAIYSFRWVNRGRVLGRGWGGHGRLMVSHRLLPILDNSYTPPTLIYVQLCTRVIHHVKGQARVDFFLWFYYAISNDIKNCIFINISVITSSYPLSLQYCSTYVSSAPFYTLNETRYPELFMASNSHLHPSARINGI